MILTSAPTGKLLNVPFEDRAGRRWCLQIHGYLFGQYRLQLWKGDDWKDQHASPAQEACTYSEDKAHLVAAFVLWSRRPLDLLRSYAHPGNCEAEGGRIRLDQ